MQEEEHRRGVRIQITAATKQFSVQLPEQPNMQTEKT